MWCSFILNYALTCTIFPAAYKRCELRKQPLPQTCRSICIVYMVKRLYSALYYYQNAVGQHSQYSNEACGIGPFKQLHIYVKVCYICKSTKVFQDFICRLQLVQNAGGLLTCSKRSHHTNSGCPLLASFRADFQTWLHVFFYLACSGSCSYLCSAYSLCLGPSGPWICPLSWH